MKYFKLSPKQRVLIKFIFTWTMMTVLDYRWQRNEPDLIHSLIYGFVFACLFALFDTIKKESDDPIAYTKLRYEGEVLERLKEMNFTFLETKNGVDIYSKPSRFKDEKIKLERTSYILKEIASEKYMRDFEEFVWRERLILILMCWKF